MVLVLLVLGLVMLAVGADILIRGGVGLAERFNVSRLLIGVTIIAYGTSTPELVVSVDAALKGIDGIAIGNVVGSNIANVLLILGITALAAPILVQPSAILRDTLFMLLATVAFIAVALTSPTVEAWHGVLFLLALVGITAVTYLAERGGGASAALHEAEAAEVKPATQAVVGNVVFIVAGLALLVVGGDLLVDSAVDIARTLGLSETVIGLTIVAVGTSMPEIAASLVAALRGHPEIAFGNVLGSSIYNILAILGLAALVTPPAIDPGIAAVDMWVMLGSALLILPVVLATGRIGRLAGVVFIGLYVAYGVSLLHRNGVV